MEESKGEPLVLTTVGSTGEKYAVIDDEWRKIVKTVVDVTNGKIPVVPGTSHSGTRVALERAKYAQDIGACASSVAWLWLIFGLIFIKHQPLMFPRKKHQL
ncbi:dihydrodipicolinate synthase family protein [Candidatus Bathyarchaeota archaeon]|nr:dihydrodipicolinate synthase family protein [Candidatus Bathyarchaeota archaeon]